MKILTYQAKSFGWESFSKTLPQVPDQDVQEHVAECVVAFFHVEAKDEEPEQRKRCLRHTIKHIKWLANKKEMRSVVLHSFAHLGGENADPTFAKGFLDEVSARLTTTGYAVYQTPFGYFCSWNLSVYGDSLAKVWKEI